MNGLIVNNNSIRFIAPIEIFITKHIIDNRRWTTVGTIGFQHMHYTLQHESPILDA